MGGGAASDPTKWSLFGRKAACDSFCAARPGWRSWAIDLGRKPGGTGHPKSFIAAEPGVFFAAYARFAPQQRHAYEIVQGPCNLFFDRAAFRGHLRKPPGRPPVGHAFAPTLGKYIDLESGKAYGDLTQEEKAKRMKTMKREAGCAGSGCSLAQFIISSAEDAGGARLGHVRARDGALLLALLLLEVGAADGLVELALLLGAV